MYNDTDQLFVIFGGLVIVVLIVAIVVFILFLLTLSKFTDAVESQKPETLINKAWVWTQLIPIWGFIAMIVFHVKATAAVRAFEVELNEPFNSIQYPVVVGWFYVLAPLYAWIPFVGGIASLVMFIIYWVQISSTSEQLFSKKQ